MMHDKMKKMLGKKRDLSDVEKSAKMDVVNDMRNQASKAMHGKLDGLKKVSVMSNSSKGLSEGLDKAKGILGGHDQQDMLNDALAPYSDAEHAHDNHMGEKGPNSLGQEQSQEESEGAYSEGGEVEESPDQGDYSDVDSESPAEHEEDMDSGEEDDMSEAEINEKLEKLMRAKERLSRK